MIKSISTICIISLCTLLGANNKILQSENKGRSGQYTVKTPVKGVNYHVFVPKSYSETNPAGILLHICGTGSSSNNSNFAYSKAFIEQYNLIGIHMQILDGRPSVNYATKIKGLQFAVAQVQADYKIIPGRGVISSFSEGSVLHGKYWSLYKKKKSPDSEWPFIHHNILSGNWVVKPEKSYMSWYMGSGNPIRPKGPDNAWTYLRPSFEYLLKTGNPQSFLRVPENKGHQYTKGDSKESAQYFHYSESVNAPFLYEADWKGEFESVARKANQKHFEAALKDLHFIENKSDTETSNKVNSLKEKITARINKLIDLSQKLLSEDIVLADYYLPIILKQLRGLPQEKELSKQFIDSRKTEKYQKVIQLNEQFRKGFRGFFGARYKAKDYGKLYTKYVPFMEECLKEAGEKSILGKMAKFSLVYKQ